MRKNQNFTRPIFIFRNQIFLKWQYFLKASCLIISYSVGRSWTETFFPKYHKMTFRISVQHMFIGTISWAIFCCDSVPDKYIFFLQRICYRVICILVKELIIVHCLVEAESHIHVHASLSLIWRIKHETTQRSHILTWTMSILSLI